MSELIQAFRKHMTKEVNEELLKELNNFKINWIKKNDGHINWLGGNLFGPDPIVFSTDDRNSFFNVVGFTDPLDFKRTLFGIKDLNKYGVVAKDDFNQVILCLIHEYSIYFKSDTKKYHEAVDLIYSIYAFKVFGSKYSKWFWKYQLEIDVAKLVFEKLSDKFLIKKLENWGEVIQHFGMKLYSTDESGFDKRMKNLKALDAGYIANDLHGTINSVVKNIYDITKTIKSSGEKIRATTSIEGIGEEASVRDIIDSPTKYMTFLKDIVLSEHDFVDFAVVDITLAIFPKIRDSIFKQVLSTISVNALQNPDINQYFIESNITVSLDYIGTAKDIDFNTDLEEIVKSLRNYWSSSRIKEKEALIVKEKVREFLKQNTTYTTGHIISNLVLAVIMYIFLKAVKYRKM